MKVADSLAAPALQGGLPHTTACGWAAAGERQEECCRPEHREDNVGFPRLLVVRTPGSGEIDFGEVKTEDRERSDFVWLSGLMPYGSPGAKGSLALTCAGGPQVGNYGFVCARDRKLRRNTKQVMCKRNITRHLCRQQAGWDGFHCVPAAP